jgi:uncharacterized protein
MNDFYSDDIPSNFIRPKNFHAKSNLILNYPLGFEAARGNIDSVKKLLALGVNIDCTGDLGHTPLHDATSMGHFDVVQLLLASGADTSLKTELNHTALDLAQQGGYKDIEKLILNNPSKKIDGELIQIKKNYVEIGLFDQIFTDINAFNQYGESMLHIATERNALPDVELLIHNHADINIVSTCGRNMTALHIAIGHGHFAIMRYLLKKGADSKIKNGFGYSALDLAMLIGEPQQLFYLYAWEQEVAARQTHRS